MAVIEVDAKIDASGSPSRIGNQMFAVRYDFSKDGGLSTDTYELIEFADACGLRLVACRVDAGLASGGSATISLGVDSGSEYFDGEAIASFGLGALVMGDAPASYFKVEAGEKIVMSIGVADLTAGSLEFLFEQISA